MILRYIKGTSGVALCFGGSKLIVKDWFDSDFACDLDKRRSTTGYVYTCRRADKLVIQAIRSSSLVY